MRRKPLQVKNICVSFGVLYCTLYLRVAAEREREKETERERERERERVEREKEREGEERGRACVSVYIMLLSSSETGGSPIERTLTDLGSLILL